MSVIAFRYGNLVTHGNGLFSRGVSISVGSLCLAIGRVVMQSPLRVNIIAHAYKARLLGTGAILVLKCLPMGIK